MIESGDERLQQTSTSVADLDLQCGSIVYAEEALYICSTGKRVAQIVCLHGGGSVQGGSVPNILSKISTWGISIFVDRWPQISCFYSFYKIL